MIATACLFLVQGEGGDGSLQPQRGQSGRSQARGREDPPTQRGKSPSERGPPVESGKSLELYREDSSPESGNSLGLEGDWILQPRVIKPMGLRGNWILQL